MPTLQEQVFNLANASLRGEISPMEWELKVRVILKEPAMMMSGQHNMEEETEGEPADE